MKINTLTATAFRRGLRDGWDQPRELSTSTAVHDMFDRGTNEDDLMLSQDLGINLGQFARLGFGSEAWQKGYWPFRTLRKVVRR